MSKNRNIWNSLKRAGAFLLSALLFAIVLVQSFHAHAATEKRTTAAHYHVAVEKCPICDFSSHQQPVDFALTETILPSLYESQIPKGQLPFKQQLVHRLLLTAADRGPPVS